MSDFDDWFIGSEDVLDLWDRDEYEMAWDAAQAKQRLNCTAAITVELEDLIHYKHDRDKIINACLNAVEKSDDTR